MVQAAERHTERDTETDRDTDTDRQTDRQTDTEIERKRARLVYRDRLLQDGSGSSVSIADRLPLVCKN